MSEKLDKLEARIKQLQARKQAMLRREAEKARKLRTRELIQTGAIFEKYFGTRNAETTEEICQLIIHDQDMKQKLKLHQPQPAATKTPT